MSVYATTSYLATQVDYTRNGTTMKVSEALNDLYGIAQTGLMESYQEGFDDGVESVSHFNSGTFTSVAGDNTISIRICTNESSSF